MICTNLDSFRFLQIVDILPRSISNFIFNQGHLVGKYFLEISTFFDALTRLNISPGISFESEADLLWLPQIQRLYRFCFAPFWPMHSVPDDFLRPQHNWPSCVLENCFLISPASMNARMKEWCQKRREWEEFSCTIKWSENAMRELLDGLPFLDTFNFLRMVIQHAGGFALVIYGQHPPRERRNDIYLWIRTED